MTLPMKNMIFSAYNMWVSSSLRQSLRACLQQSSDACWHARTAEPSGGKMAHDVAGPSGHVCSEAPLHGRSNHWAELTYGEEKNVVFRKIFGAFCDTSNFNIAGCQHDSADKIFKKSQKLSWVFSGFSLHFCDCLCFALCWRIAHFEISRRCHIYQR